MEQSVNPVSKILEPNAQTPRTQGLGILEPGSKIGVGH